MKTQVKYEVGYRDDSIFWWVEEFAEEIDAVSYLEAVQAAGHRDIVLGIWEKEGDEWYCMESYDEKTCEHLGFLPESKEEE